MILCAFLQALERTDWKVKSNNKKLGSCSRNPGRGNGDLDQSDGNGDTEKWRNSNCMWIVRTHSIY